MSNSNETPTGYSELKILNNIFTTKFRTISINNIATLTLKINKSGDSAKSLFLLLSALLVTVGIIVFVTSSNRETAIIAPLVLIIGAIFFAVLAFNQRNLFSLIISTNDGIKSVFSSEDLKSIQEIRTFLDERIENKESTGNYTINFTTGKIEKLNIENVEKVDAEIEKADIEKLDQHVETMQAETIVSGSTGINIARDSTGIIQGDQNQVGSIEVNQQVIDYTPFLPVMMQWQTYIAQQAPNNAIESKFDELIELMKSGTPQPEEKSRLRVLGQELSGYLQGYTGFAQLMNDTLQLLA